MAVRDYRGQYRWIPGVITSKTGPISYKVSIAPGNVWRRHTDQIRSADFALQPDSQGTTLVTRPEKVIPVTNTTKMVEPTAANKPQPVERQSSSDITQKQPTEPRYPVRKTRNKRPERLDL